MATGVVSADRRYVRITCQPLFSAVTNVHTFTIGGSNSGMTTQTPGVGTGGSGYSGGRRRQQRRRNGAWAAAVLVSSNRRSGQFHG